MLDVLKKIQKFYDVYKQNHRKIREFHKGEKLTLHLK